MRYFCLTVLSSGPWRPGHLLAVDPLSWGKKKLCYCCQWHHKGFTFNLDGVLTIFLGVLYSKKKHRHPLQVYSKSGKQVKTFPSNLPGGNRSQGGRYHTWFYSRTKTTSNVDSEMSFCYFPILATCRVRNSYTILDCVYSDTNGIFYILDMMCWDGYQVNIASICHIYDTYDLFVS